LSLISIFPPNCSFSTSDYTILNPVSDTFKQNIPVHYIQNKLTPIVENISIPRLNISITPTLIPNIDAELDRGFLPNAYTDFGYSELPWHSKHPLAFGVSTSTLVIVILLITAFWIWHKRTAHQYAVPSKVIRRCEETGTTKQDSPAS